MQFHDPHDQFQQSWRNSGQYPTFQTEPREIHEFIEIERLRQLLVDREGKLFDKSDPQVDVWETGIRNKFPVKGNLKSISELSALQDYLVRAEKDPQIRHLFIESDSSRSPLNCSPEMFKLICAYQQVEPSFLDSVFSFGEQLYPIDVGLAQFKSRMPAAKQAPNIKRLPRIGRSGRQINLSYLLRSIERSEGSGVEAWQIRQAANYHSFDLETGRSFWFTIKGNDVLKERIKDFTPRLEIPSKNDSQGENIVLCLKATLVTHLIYLSWCDDSWRDFMNDLEMAIRETSQPARIARVDDHVSATQPHTVWPPTLQQQRQATTFSYHSRQNTGFDVTQLEKASSISMKERAISFGRSMLGRPREAKPDEEQGESAPIDPSGSLDRLRVKDIQTLYSYLELIQRALLVLDLNSGVLRDIHAHYDQLREENLGVSSCGSVVDDFLLELKSIMRRLETRRAQLDSLSAYLSNSIQLYELVLQQRTNFIGNKFADNAHESANQMKIVADRTARQTASMHVITVVTLIFLPATFVAVRETFFQSGVLLWNEETPEGMTEPFRYQKDSFLLFLAVCGPLTTITMGVWLYVFLKLKWRAMRDEVRTRSACAPKAKRRTKVQ